MLYESISLSPIGILHTRVQRKYHACRQASLNQDEALINLYPGKPWEQALEGLEGFQRIWVIFYMNQAKHAKMKVLAPRLSKKIGVLATRSPHRPNPLGLSCVELKAVEKNKLIILGSDLLDGTPILDIKPYIPYADAFPQSKAGWIDTLGPHWLVQWDPEILNSVIALQAMGEDRLCPVAVERILAVGPYPSHNNRIAVEGKHGQLAMGAWRLDFEIRELSLYIFSLKSGYETLDCIQDQRLRKLHSPWLSVSIDKKEL